MLESPGKIRAGYKCGICNDTGWIERQEEHVGLMYTFAHQCECVIAEWSKQRIEKSGLQHMLKTCAFDAYETTKPWQETAKNLAMEFVNNTDAEWFYIGGAIGSGKTHLCTAIVSALLKQGKPARYMLWRDESVRLKACVNDEAGYYEAINPLKTVDVLYIDDFFKTQQGDAPTKGDVNLAFELLNHRYNNPRLITIISSEHTIDDLLTIDEAVGSRILQRTKDYCVIIPRDKRKNYRLKGMVTNGDNLRSCDQTRI